MFRILSKNHRPPQEQAQASQEQTAAHDQPSTDRAEPVGGLDESSSQGLLGGGARGENRRDGRGGHVCEFSLGIPQLPQLPSCNIGSSIRDIFGKANSEAAEEVMVAPAETAVAPQHERLSQDKAASRVETLRKRPQGVREKMVRDVRPQVNAEPFSPSPSPSPSDQEQARGKVLKRAPLALTRKTAVVSSRQEQQRVPLPAPPPRAPGAPSLPVPHSAPHHRPRYGYGNSHSQQAWGEAAHPSTPWAPDHGHHDPYGLPPSSPQCPHEGYLNLQRWRSDEHHLMPPDAEVMFEEQQQHQPPPPNLGPEAVAAFSKALESGQQRLRSVKLCFVGHARAGKTSTLLALAGRDFDPAQPSTHGVDTCSVTQELLQAKEAAAEPWGLSKHGGGSLAGILARGVARTTAESLRDYKEDQEPSGSASSGKAASPPAGQQPTPEVLKMPVDLVARALDGEDGDEVEQVTMQTWDFAGQEMYYSMAHVFLTSHGIYVLVLDLSAWAGPWGGSGEPPKSLVDSVDFWLAALLLHAPDAHLVIVGTHDDAIPEDDRPTVRARVDGHLARHLERMPSLHGRLLVNEQDQLLFYPVDNSRASSEGQATVDRLRAALNMLALEAADGFGMIPTRWAHLYHILDEEKANGGRPVVSLEDCARLAGPLNLPGHQLEPCLELFHGLGQLLHFKGSPAVVLDPQWLLDAMAHVVACPRVLQRHSHRARALHDRGELSAELLDVLWAGERFAGQRGTLQAFLEHFDLLVPGLGASAEEDNWLVPSMLPPRRPNSGSAPTPPPEDGVLLLDFHGALQKLLPSLLLRLLGHLKSLQPLQLRTFEVCRDFACFAVGQRPLWVTTETLPRASPEVVRFGICGLPPDSTAAFAEVKNFLEAVSEALLAWIPRLSFATKIPCPLCSKSGQSTNLAHMHLLDLEEVLGAGQVLCPRACQSIHEHLPPWLQRWRNQQLGEAASQALIPASPASSSTAREEWRVSVDFLYASPLAFGRRVLEELDVQTEARALRGLPALGLGLHVATATALGEALAAGGHRRTVLHLSAHCALYPQPVLLLEDEIGGAYAVDFKELASMGPWDRPGLLLVFLACGSELLVRSLLEECQLRLAICCAGEVFDAAARVFCRALYHALCAGHGVEAAYELARAAVRGSANPGLRSEADKFLLLSSEPNDIPGDPWGHPGPPPEPPPRWPLWPPVEDYVPRVAETLRVASIFVHRRAILLWGGDGMGKTSFCREFCRHFTAPGGRLLSVGAFWMDRGSFTMDEGDGGFNQTLMAELRAAGGEASPSSSSSSSRAALREQLRRLDEEGRWLLVLDGLQGQEESLFEALDNLLQDSAHVRVLLTARAPPSDSRWAAGLAGVKLQSLELAPLPPQQSALLFLRRVRRPLFPCDLDASAPGPEEPGGSEPLRLPSREAAMRMTREAQNGGLLQRLAASPLLHALGGIPGRVVQAAALVDKALPSLLQHPFLPLCWREAEPC